MRRDRTLPEGAVHTFFLDSTVLKDNLFDDPHERRIDVYVPAGHDGAGLPLLVDLVGYTAGGPAATNWRNYGENVPERLDRLIGTGAMPPVAAAFPDCFTRLVERRDEALQETRSRIPTLRRMLEAQYDRLLGILS